MITRRRFLQTTAAGVAAAALAARTTTEAITTVRKRLAQRPECDEGCPGWGIFHVDREPWVEIERCDQCAGSLTPPITDDDVALLPEAQAALRKEQG